jgi:murein L,D-transpeptidase YcbB/YkuD
MNFLKKIWRAFTQRKFVWAVPEPSDPIDTQAGSHISMPYKQKFDVVELSDIPWFVRAQQRRVYTVFIHCSATDAEWADNAETMDKWHKERGWREIGYHLFIQKDGTMQLGRDWNQVPAAQRMHNEESLAICLHGLDKNKFTASQLRVFVDFCKRLDEEFFKQKSYHMRFRGHCEVAAKLCPVIDYEQLLNLDRNGEISTHTAVSTPKTEVYKLGTVRIFDRGDDVIKVQRLLNKHGADPQLVVDGLFGRDTERAVKRFQVRNDLVPDGVVGKNTRKKLLS